MHTRAALCVEVPRYIPRGVPYTNVVACINLHKLIPMQTKRFDVELGYHASLRGLHRGLNELLHMRTRAGCFARKLLVWI